MVTLVTPPLWRFTMKLLKLALLLFVVISLNGCVLTKLVSVPMRVVGAVVSIIPVAGNSAHDAIDTGADAVDSVPI